VDQRSVLLRAELQLIYLIRFIATITRVRVIVRPDEALGIQSEFIFVRVTVKAGTQERGTEVKWFHTGNYTEMMQEATINDSFPSSYFM